MKSLMRSVRNAANLVYKLGRFGKFLACSGFPDCRNTKPIIKDIGVTCPKCHEGKVVERRSKKGVFSMAAISTLVVISFHGIDLL